MKIRSRISTEHPSGASHWATPELEGHVEGILASLSDEQKCRLLSGADMWTLRPLSGTEPAAGTLPATRLADCGHGLTQTAERTEATTCFPTGIALASTWNEALIEETGRALAADCRRHGVDVLLGPMINLHRVPVNGRSFETFSEDPVLAGVLGAAEIRGLQSAGVGACVKSVVANNQQHEQHATSVEVDDRPLRELYLRAFEIAVREGDPVSIMTSYNPLRGEQTAECRWLIREVIKSEWAFPGFIVSDWRAVRSETVYESGLDLEMPGPGKLLGPDQLHAALQSGKITRDDFEDRVRRMVRVRLACANGLGGANGAGRTNWAGEPNSAVARRVAEESIVLLKNDDVLPFDGAKLRRIAVIGPNAAEARLGGGGSASVSPPYAISPLAGIRERVGNGVTVDYVEGCGLLGDMDVVRGGSGFKARFFGGAEPEGEVLWEGVVEQIDFSWGWSSPAPGVSGAGYAVEFTGEIDIEETGAYTFGLMGQEGPIRMWLDGELVVDDWFGEREERNFEAEFEVRHRQVTRTLTAGSRVSVVVHYAKRSPRAAVRLEWRRPGGSDGITRGAEAASRADAVVLCVGLSNIFEGGTRDRTTLELPPAQLELIAAVTKANPVTVAVLVNGGPVLCPWVDSVAGLLEAWYPGQEGGRALAAILFGDVNPSGRLPDTIGRSWDDYRSLAHYPGDGREVHYREGRFVGYRHFDKAAIEPRFPFGFGLGYSQFSIGTPTLSGLPIAAERPVTVAVDLANTGGRRGKCVVQLYVRRPAAPERARLELRNFAKIDLAPAETRRVEFEVSYWDLAEWDEEEAAWTVRGGRYAVGVGLHSRSLSEVELGV